MKFKFKIQKYQTEAVESVVSVFAGQSNQKSLSYTRDVGNDDQFRLLDEDYVGYRNNDLTLSEGELLGNIHQVQTQNNIELSDSLNKALGNCSIDIEMETGTGKTYVYIKTIFELNKKYGWSKFIVIVPSIAIREGVLKSFNITTDHFMEYYGKKARYFVYDSSNLNALESFSSSSDINVMIINTQAFASSLKEGAKNKYSRIIYDIRDEFGSRRPIDVISANRPILILDEPQKMGGKVSKEAMKRFNPLFSLNYSATHKETHNTVYRLDALDAFNKKLVKRIAVKGYSINNLYGTGGYLFLNSIVLSPNKPPMAKLDMEVKLKSGIKRIVKTLTVGDNLFHESGELGEYKGYVISDIDPLEDSVTFTNDVVIRAGEAMGDVAEEDLRRIQIRETIESHFEKEEANFGRGIKTLSLFFIDEVAKYRQYDDEGNELLGEYGRIFEEEYAEVLESRKTLMKDDPYQVYLREQCSDIHHVHNGYFSIDKKGRSIDSEIKRGSEYSEDISAYDLILKDKERLLSFEEPARFIFSHSALREGWDNPNVFQICALKHSKNDVAQRQEVGRGLRLCVNQDGNRMDLESCGSFIHNINKLTVIASGSYSDYVNKLQHEIGENLADRPRKADEKYFNGKTVKSNGELFVIGEDEARAIYKYLIKNDYLNDDDTISSKFKEDKASGLIAEMPDSLKSMQDDLLTLIQGVYDPSVLGSMIEDDRKTKVQENPLNENFYKKEFQELWEAISPQYAYRVDFDSDELIKKSINFINEHGLKVKTLQYVVTEGGQEDNLTKDDILFKNMFNESTTKVKQMTVESTNVKYDLVGKVAAGTKLTRRTIVAILQGIVFSEFEKFKVNPEDFIDKVIAAVNSQKATMVVEHIQYNPTGQRYEADIFTAEKNERDLLKAYKAKKNVQDYLFPDGMSENSVERNFAASLDISDEVLVYAKLPRGFKIPTPVGSYAPDWAIAFKEGTVKHVFFVAETKGTMDSQELRGIESTKIACAKKLFKSISTRDIAYDYVSSFDDLMSIMNSI